MKRITIAKLAIFAVLAAAVSSCSLMGPSTGNISIALPQDIPNASRMVESRAIGTFAEAKFVRIYLEANGSIVPLKKGQDFLEVQIPTNRVIEISDVPPMRNCMIYVSMSKDEKANFRTIQYVASDKTFNIVAGGTAELNLQLKESLFKDLYLAQNSAGVKAVTVGNTLFTLVGSTLNWPESSLQLIGIRGITAVNGLTKGRVMNANGSFGADQVWVNTDKGIFPLIGASLGDTVNKGVAAADSGVLTLTYPKDGGTATTSVAYYQKTGSIGIGQGKDGAWKWEEHDVTKFINSTDPKIIADSSTSLNGSFAYLIVPAINSFRIGGDAIKKFEDLGKDPSFQQVQDTLLKGNTLTVPPVNGLKPLVQGVSYQKGFLFIGTNLGLFSLQVSQTDGSLPPLPGDATKLKPADPVQFPRIANIVRVRSTTLASGVVATAALTRNGELFILKDGVVAGEYRFFMGLPFEPGEREAGKTADLFWTEKGLVVTGTNGVVELPVDKL